MTANKNSIDTTKVKLSPLPGVTDVALAKPDDLAPATTFAASGATIEPAIIDRVDMSHPAVDDAPRKCAPAVSNQIDFNDPTLTDAEQVAKNLGLPAAASK